LGNRQSGRRSRIRGCNAVDGCLIHIDEALHARCFRHNLPLVRVGEVNRKSVTDLQNRVHKSIRELRAQHRSDLLAPTFKSLSESVSSVSALCTHVTCDAAVDTRIPERILSIEFKELRHRKGWDAGQNKNT